MVALDDGAAEARLNDELRALLNDAACHDIKGYITCSYSESPKVAKILKAWRMRDIVDVQLRGQEVPIIETIARIKHEPPASETLAIAGAELLADEELILLKRAFGDCSSVKLVKQTTGSAKVFLRIREPVEFARWARSPALFCQVRQGSKDYPRANKLPGVHHVACAV
ncbi:hypothetical protein [Bradyrhizobium yuanmingense]|uniref:hypothetical protein n=1 Tax=Bradyrhizobium yuanmingense TaxID=108015 RepID=UPI0023B8DF5F|nr:hypothetical protein [Bradyrhizobium yuanmingense]MDF0498162.1 hypothetical protein [Bradyrhizobium yuanmingense]